MEYIKNLARKGKTMNLVEHLVYMDRKYFKRFNYFFFFFF